MTSERFERFNTFVLLLSPTVSGVELDAVGCNEHMHHCCQHWEYIGWNAIAHPLQLHVNTRASNFSVMSQQYGTYETRMAQAIFVFLMNDSKLNFDLTPVA